MPQSLTAAAGWISQTAALLATQLADTDAFRTFVGAADQAAALARIYHNALPPPAKGDAHSLIEWERYRPHALIWTEDEGLELINDSCGPGVSIAAQGSLVIAFERAVPTSIRHDPAEVDRTFQNTIGKICHTGDPEAPGLMDLAHDPRYLQITRLRLRGIARTAVEDLEDLGDAQRAWLQVTWSTD